MNDDAQAPARDDLKDDSNEMAPARGVGLGVVIGAFIWFAATLAVAYWRFVA